MLNAKNSTGRLAALRRWIVALGLGFGLGVSAACTPLYNNHGYIPPEQELALLEVGRDTRETVKATVGTPSAAGLLNDHSWYYVQSTWKRYGPYAPSEQNRQVLAISFDEAGVISNIERFGLEQGKIVTLSRRVTESTVKGQSLLRQLFGNIGKINTGDLMN